MRKVELVFFEDCPNVPKAKEALRLAGVSESIEVNQDKIDQNHSYRRFSSPTVLVDGRIVLGSDHSSSACSIIDWDLAVSKIRERISEDL